MAKRTKAELFDLRHYDPQVFDFSWLVYDRYLRASGVRAGIVSYSNDLRMLVGTRYDADGLPLRGLAGKAYHRE